MFYAFSLVTSFVFIVESVETEQCFGLDLLMLAVNANQGKKCITFHT